MSNRENWEQRCFIGFDTHRGDWKNQDPRLIQDTWKCPCPLAATCVQWASFGGSDTEATFLSPWGGQPLDIMHNISHQVGWNSLTWKIEKQHGWSLNHQRQVCSTFFCPSIENKKNERVFAAQMTDSCTPAQLASPFGAIALLMASLPRRTLTTDENIWSPNWEGRDLCVVHQVSWSQWKFHLTRHSQASQT